VVQESTLIWNKTTIISIQAETLRVQTEQITVDMDGIESQLRELEQQADEDEQLVTQVWTAAGLSGDGRQVPQLQVGPCPHSSWAALRVNSENSNNRLMRTNN